MPELLAGRPPSAAGPTRTGRPVGLSAGPVAHHQPASGSACSSAVAAADEAYRVVTRSISGYRFGRAPVRRFNSCGRGRVVITGFRVRTRSPRRAARSNATRVEFGVANAPRVPASGPRHPRGLRSRTADLRLTVRTPIALRLQPPPTTNDFATPQPRCHTSSPPSPATAPPGTTIDLRLVDSTPVECGRSRETVKRSDLAGWASYGDCALHSRFFWGSRLHLIATPSGLPVARAQLRRDR